MRNLFSWRLHPPEDYFKDLWENATFVFDTNFLLDLYRVSHDTARDYLRILKHLEERIWLPYQVAYEFLERREEVIDKEKISFQKALEALDKWKEEQLKFNSLRNQMSQAGRIIGSEVESLFDQQDDYKAAIEKVEQCFNNRIKELSQAHFQTDSDQDFILEDLLNLFNNKTGRSFDEVTLKHLYKEGDERFNQKKPPGFMDVKKEDNSKYGDWILWRQTIDFAKEKSCSVVIVTSEKKEDWWIKKQGKMVSPHYQLRKEFQETVNQKFWIYHTQNFLKLAEENLGIRIRSQSIEETNLVSESKTNEELYESQQQAQPSRSSEESIRDLQNQEYLNRLDSPNLIQALHELYELQQQMQNSPINEELDRARSLLNSYRRANTSELPSTGRIAGRSAHNRTANEE